MKYSGEDGRVIRFDGFVLDQCYLSRSVLVISSITDSFLFCVPAPRAVPRLPAHTLLALCAKYKFAHYCKSIISTKTRLVDYMHEPLTESPSCTPARLPKLDTNCPASVVPCVCFQPGLNPQNGEVETLYLFLPARLITNGERTLVSTK